MGTSSLSQRHVFLIYRSEISSFTGPPRNSTCLLRIGGKDTTLRMQSQRGFVERCRSTHHQCRRPFFEELVLKKSREQERQGTRSFNSSWESFVQVCRQKIQTINLVFSHQKKHCYYSNQPLSTSCRFCVHVNLLREERLCHHYCDTFLFCYMSLGYREVFKSSSISRKTRACTFSVSWLINSLLTKCAVPRSYLASVND